MVSIHKKKPIKLKCVRGGNFFLEALKNILNNEGNDEAEAGNFLEKWNRFIKILFNDGNNGNEEMTEEEITTAIEKFRKNIVISDSTSGRSSSRSSSRSSGRVTKKGLLTRSANFRQLGPDEFANLPCGDEDNSSSSLYQQFDNIFNDILIKIKSSIDKKQGEKKSEESKESKELEESKESKGFQRIITLLNALPGIDKNLPKLVDTTNIKTPIDRLKKIIELLKEECGGFKKFVCGTALTIISNVTKDENISKLYKDLIDANKDAICDKDLKKFIENVIPIIEKNLAGVKEFAKELKDLAKLPVNLNDSSVGGKKSSRSGRKEIHGKQEKIYIKSNCKNKNKDIVAKTSHKPVIIAKKIILGKERCIYKIQGSKREHVKYKGSIITVTDYKKLMKVL